ncbi:MAG TPA: GNAT family N-acetyltransferase [Bryobacteraceae bacterium]|nr:GNAT family N-acetyltransferase [Bryobacteraceae bacterium]
MKIVHVAARSEIVAAQSLFREYWESFGFSPCFQNFADEVASLPGKYALPSGRLGLGLIDDEAVGCVALRQVDAHRCEAKRLYVRNQFRGRGFGEQLLAWIIAEARAAGYRELVGDTMPYMDRALAMYDRFGFIRTEPYSLDPTPGAIYLTLRLDVNG